MPELQGEYQPAVPSRVIFGRGKVDGLREEVENLGGKRALLLSGKSVAEKTDAVRRTAAGLGDTLVGTFSGLTQRAPIEATVEVTRMALETGADTLVSCDMGCLMQIGGGLSRQDSDIKVRHLAQVLDQDRSSNS